MNFMFLLSCWEMCRLVAPVSSRLCQSSRRPIYNFATRHPLLQYPACFANRRSLSQGSRNPALLRSCTRSAIHPSQLKPIEASGSRSGGVVGAPRHVRTKVPRASELISATPRYRFAPCLLGSQNGGARASVGNAGNYRVTCLGIRMSRSQSYFQQLLLVGAECGS